MTNVVATIAAARRGFLGERRRQPSHEVIVVERIGHRIPSRGQRGRHRRQRGGAQHQHAQRGRRPLDNRRRDRALRPDDRVEVQPAYEKSTPV
jgi:hypothetical protein